MWNTNDSHVTFQECQSKLKKVFDQAEDPKWVANLLVKLTEDTIHDVQQIPCDTCEYNVKGACCTTDCPY